MKTFNLPFFASGFGLFLLIVVVEGSKISDDGYTVLPLLTLLIISEFAFFLTAIGAIVGIKHARATGLKPFYLSITVLCIVLSVSFMVLGIKLWPL